MQHMNYVGRPEELQALRDEDRPFLKFCRQVFLSQPREEINNGLLNGVSRIKVYWDLCIKSIFRLVI